MLKYAVNEPAKNPVQDKPGSGLVLPHTKTIVMLSLLF